MDYQAPVLILAQPWPLQPFQEYSNGCTLSFPFSCHCKFQINKESEIEFVVKGMQVGLGVPKIKMRP